MIEWQHPVRFAGEQPPAKEPIAVELDGLESCTWDALRKWADAREPEGEPKRKRRVVELPEGCWRPAVLDDFVDGQLTSWRTPFGHYGLEDYAAFVDTWAPRLRAAMDAAIEACPGASRLKAMKQASKLSTRVVNVLGWIPNRLDDLTESERRRLDKKLVKRLREEATPWPEMVGQLAKLRSDTYRARALTEIANDLAADQAIGAGDIMRFLDLVWENEPLRNAVAQTERFWRAVGPKVSLEATETEGAFDITNAGEMTVQLDWDTVRAKRVGPISVGRTALAVRDEQTHDLTLVRGERKLKFDAMRRGGSLKRHGCTLTVRPAPSVQIRTAFLDAERITTIAAVDPLQALELVAELNLPDDHVVVRTAREAVTDLAKRRALADLLIELRHGLDPAVARSMMHSSRR
jgi:hypothetical protein